MKIVQLGKDWKILMSLAVQLIWPYLFSIVISASVRRNTLSPGPGKPAGSPDPAIVYSASFRYLES